MLLSFYKNNTEIYNKENNSWIKNAMEKYMENANKKIDK